MQGWDENVLGPIGSYADSDGIDATEACCNCGSARNNAIVANPCPLSHPHFVVSEGVEAGKLCYKSFRGLAVRNLVTFPCMFTLP